MTAGLPLVKLIAPIAAATIVTSVWFAMMWRGHKTERMRGKPTWQYELGLISYIVAVGAFAYFRSDQSSSAPLDLFGAALVGEGLGIVITFALVQTFVLAHDKPWRERAFPIVATVFLTGIVFAALLTA